jgi:putative oxidoreductase
MACLSLVRVSERILIDQTTGNHLMNPLTNFIALVGRILLAFLFVQGGYGKLFGGMAGTVATMTSHGIPFPDILVWGAVVVELGIGLCLMAGLLARWAALILAAYTLTLGLIFHSYWLAPAAEARSSASSSSITFRSSAAC